MITELFKLLRSRLLSVLQANARSRRPQYFASLCNRRFHYSICVKGSITLKYMLHWCIFQRNTFTIHQWRVFRHIIWCLYPLQCCMWKLSPPPPSSSNMRGAWGKGGREERGCLKHRYVSHLESQNEHQKSNVRYGTITADNPEGAGCFLTMF